MSKYIKHEINYDHPELDKVTVKEYGVDLGKCPACGLDAVIVEYSGIGWVGCPLSHMIYYGNRHPCTGYNGKTCTRKPIAVSRWLHMIRPLKSDPEQSKFAQAMKGEN